MTWSSLLRSCLVGAALAVAHAETPAPFNGLGVDLSNVWRLSPAKSRSISAENFTGEKGKGGMATEGASSRAAEKLGQGWKVSPRLIVARAKRSRSRRSRGRAPSSTCG